MNPLYPNEIVDLAERGITTCDEILRLLTNARITYEMTRSRLLCQKNYYIKYSDVLHRMYCEDVSDQLDKIAADARKLADKMYAYTDQHR